jgi:hypothetical protein
VVDVGSIDVPKAPVIGVIPLGFLLLTLQFLLRTIEDARRFKGESGSRVKPLPGTELGSTPGEVGG